MPTGIPLEIIDETLENGGLHSVGVNFNAKVHRSSVELEGFFLGRIVGIDTFPRETLNEEK